MSVPKNSKSAKRKTSNTKINVGSGRRGSPGYETTPKSNRGAGAYYTYSHREGAGGPKRGLGSSDL